MSRSMTRIVFGMLLGAGVTGCANQPETRGIFWWPQGPGTTAEDLKPAASSPQPLRQNDELFVSGQIAAMPDPGTTGQNGLEGQLRNALDNAFRMLASHGLVIADIVSVTLYARDIDDLQRANTAYAAYFPRNLPARAVVGR